MFQYLSRRAAASVLHVAGWSYKQVLSLLVLERGSRAHVAGPRKSRLCSYPSLLAAEGQAASIPVHAEHHYTRGLIRLLVGDAMFSPVQPSRTT